MLEGLGQQGSNKVDASGAVSGAAEVKGPAIPADSISKSSASDGGKSAPAIDSPELEQAAYIFWFGNNQMLLQNYEGNSVEELTPKIVAMQLKNDMMAITQKVLDEWTKSIHEQGEQMLRKLKSQQYQNERERNSLNYESYLKTVSTEQKLNLEEFNRFNPAAAAPPHVEATLKLDEVLSRTQNDSKFVDASPFILGSAINSTARTDVQPAVGQLNVGPLDVTPIRDGVNSVLGSVASSYSVDLAAVASLYATGAMNLAAINTFPVAAAAEPPKIDYEYSRNYAKQILKVVNDSEFNSFAMAIISHTTPEDQQLQKGQITALTRYLKIALLSTALAFLHSMETSFKGVGGGIKGPEFMALMQNDGPADLNDPKGQLISQIKDELSQVPEQSSQLLASIDAWLDQTNNIGLMKVSPLFNMMRVDNPVATPYVVNG
jgi:hypothetical protein